MANLELLTHHLQIILKDCKDQAGSTIDLSKLSGQVHPAFFDIAPQDQETVKHLRNVGYTTFYASLSSYTIVQFNTLNTVLLERILLQALSVQPLVKVAQCLELDQPMYTTQYTHSDRLAVLVGTLYADFGNGAVDLLLHPLFTHHIFKKKHSISVDTANLWINFSTVVKSRGGTFEVDYQEVQNNKTGTLHKWQCSAIYQLARNAPRVLHRRIGPNKKQAKARVLQDIDTYYTNNNDALMAHCSPSSNLTNGTIDPLNQQQPEPIVETLSIPTDQLYQYDDDVQMPIPTAQVIGKRPFDTTMDTMDNDTTAEGVTSNKQVSFLANALLYDFERLSCDEQQSPTSSISSVKSSTVQRLALSTNGHQLASPTPASSPSSATTTNGIFPATNGVEDEVMDDGDSISKKQRLCQSDDNQPQHGYTAECDMTMTPVSLSPRTPLQESDMSGSSIIAHNITSLLSEKDRRSLKTIGAHVSQHPGDIKGHLKNLALKIQGEYNVEFEKDGNLPFTAIVRFGRPGLTLETKRSRPKKSDAEILAATEIYALLEAAIIPPS
ncbi:hypothetical protein [Absidia glauca]|uniref:Uncharacterized protein n=1 Tax=Absidia glauca TaxID=4829 RepID=A0A168QLS2_ABSGL|nr:hypothetical protein [Absidia glauca]